MGNVHHHHSYFYVYHVSLCVDDVVVDAVDSSDHHGRRDSLPMGEGPTTTSEEERPSGVLKERSCFWFKVGR